MTRIPKRPSYKYKNYLACPKNFLPLRVIIYIVLFSTFFLFLPAYLTLSIFRNHILFLLFYLINIFIIFYLVKIYARKKYRLELEVQDLREKSNILSDGILHERNNYVALQEKLRRYNSLKKIIEEISQNLTLEFIADALSEIAFSLIAGDKGTCMLYLVDPQTQKLILFKTKKEDKRLIIKAKEGDIFDFWVTRHASPLLVEDTHKDFRFDLEKFKVQDIRPISSLIAAPFISEHRLLGILRLDNHQAAVYTQDDLRFLVTISDLGAVALENGELFQKTQDLATHDGLTALYTKGYFLRYLQEECKRNMRNRMPLSLLMLDIDYFKNYNDKFGHTAGDIVLKRLSLTMSEFLKDLNPLICRFGGEEFCVVLNQADKNKAKIIAQGLREKIEKTKIILRRQETNITVSIGVATLSVDAKDDEELIIKADRACLEAKQKGRNRVVCA